VGFKKAGGHAVAGFRKGAASPAANKAGDISRTRSGKHRSLLPAQRSPSAARSPSVARSPAPSVARSPVSLRQSSLAVELSPEEKVSARTAAAAYRETPWLSPDMAVSQQQLRAIRQCEMELLSSIQRPPEPLWATLAAIHALLAAPAHTDYAAPSSWEEARTELLADLPDAAAAQRRALQEYTHELERASREARAPPAPCTNWTRLVLPPY
jgi:hypothetical protein